MSPPIPFYRNVRVLAWLAQMAFALGVVGLAWLLLSTMLGNLQKQGIPISFAFLPQPDLASRKACLFSPRNRI